MITCNSNGKRYVGMTNKDAESRFKEHLRAAKRGEKVLLYFAIRKYGEDSFSVVTLCLVADFDEACLMEKKYMHGQRNVRWSISMLEILPMRLDR